VGREAHAGNYVTHTLLLFDDIEERGGFSRRV
jgi:hypothetical protein